VERFLRETREGPWELVFVDPPYEERAIVAPLRAVVPHLAPGASLVVKHFWRTELPEVNGLEAVRQRRFGETMLTFWEAKNR
jgi:16S rRNA G966 N2-methylase RsmD